MSGIVKPVVPAGAVASMATSEDDIVRLYDLCFACAGVGVFVPLLGAAFAVPLKAFALGVGVLEFALALPLP